MNSYAYWCIVHKDRTRKVLDKERAMETANIPAGAEAYLIHRSASELSSTKLRNGRWLAYDWTLSTEPVNQWSYIHPWRAHVGRFAHGFDALPGFESFNQLSAAQKATAFRVGQTIGGARPGHGSGSGPPTTLL